MRWLMLSATENRVLELTLQGKSKSKIALILHLSPRTIAQHISNILAQTDCRNCHELTAYILNHRIKELQESLNAINKKNSL